MKLGSAVLCLLLVCQLNKVVALYQWQCSTSEDEDGIRYLPSDVSPRVETLNSLPTATFMSILPGVLFIYQVPQDLLTNCDGTVTAIEYCYRSDDNRMGGIRRVFTFYRLHRVSPQQNKFRIEDRFEVWSQPTSSTCQSNNPRCCDRFEVPLFSLESTLTFGVLSLGTTTGTDYNLLRLSSTELYGVDGFQFNANGLSNTTNVITGQTSSSTIAFLRFVISPPNASTATDIPVETTSESVPPNVFTTVTDLSTTQTGLTTDTSTPQDDSTTDTPQQLPTSEATVPPGTLQTTSSSPGEFAGNRNILGIAVGAVVGGLTAIIVVVVVVIIIVVCTMKRRDKKIWKLKEDTLNCSLNEVGITNAMYSVSPQIGSGMLITTNVTEGQVGFTKSTTSYDDVIIGDKTQSVNEYSLPDEFLDTRVPNGSKEVAEYTYATTEAGKQLVPVPSQYNSHGSDGGYSFADHRGTNSYRGRGYSKKNSETVHYMVPAKDANSLYAQFNDMKITSLTQSNIKITSFLGSGQFGTVHKGVWQSGDREVEVAVKTLKEGSTENDKVKFLQEAAIMGQFSHPNVVKLHGVVSTWETVHLVLELLPNGDLRNHLIDLRNQQQIGVDEHTLLSYCRQVASGMCYLANKSFVHRDLAARNVLVAEDDVCKIADFGMSRDLEDESYYIAHGGKIPVKWTAPEALNYQKYSTASDVWSYGCIMYEIWSLGHKPFEYYSNQQAIKIIEEGFRLPPPTGCPRAIYEIMVSCWHPLTFERPSFNDLMQKLSMPDTRLLKWSDEDKAVHPEASKLGAELEHASELYKDLQTLYIREASQYEVPKPLVSSEPEQVNH